MYWGGIGGQKAQGTGLGQRGEERITGVPVKIKDRHYADNSFYTIIYFYVAGSYQADRFPGSGQGLICYIIVNYCHMDAGKENI